MADGRSLLGAYRLAVAACRLLLAAKPFCLPSSLDLPYPTLLGSSLIYSTLLLLLLLLLLRTNRLFPVSCSDARRRLLTAYCTPLIACCDWPVTVTPCSSPGTRDAFPTRPTLGGCQRITCVFEFRFQSVVFRFLNSGCKFPAEAK